jgi:UDP-N-acetylglucosamine 2-epimerase
MIVATIVGNRPQFVKSAPLSLALRDAGIDEVVVHTGQHWDPEMSQIFFDELDLPEPRYRLDLRTSDIQAMTEPIRDAIENVRPDWVIVLGDTNSTVAGARAAGEEIPVAHVEAGLRSFDSTMPEERNRIEVDELSALLFCPDERSSLQLEREGVRGRREVVGDVMADATRIFQPIARRVTTPPGDPYCVLTIHRQANVQPERLRRIAEAVTGIDRTFVFPAHPRTRRALEDFDIPLGGNVGMVEPLGYLEMVALVAGSDVVVTDSGGLQKESYWLGVPCVTVRPTTEWVDTVEVGANRLAEPEGLAQAVEDARFPAVAPALYGDGHASERIARALYP